MEISVERMVNAEKVISAIQDTLGLMHKLDWKPWIIKDILQLIDKCTNIKTQEVIVVNTT